MLLAAMVRRVVDPRCRRKQRAYQQVKQQRPPRSRKPPVRRNEGEGISRGQREVGCSEQLVLFGPAESSRAERSRPIHVRAETRAGTNPDLHQKPHARDSGHQDKNSLCCAACRERERHPENVGGRSATRSRKIEGRLRPATQLLCTGGYGLLHAASGRFVRLQVFGVGLATPCCSVRGTVRDVVMREEEQQWSKTPSMRTNGWHAYRSGSSQGVRPPTPTNPTPTNPPGHVRGIGAGDVGQARGRDSMLERVPSASLVDDHQKRRLTAILARGCEVLLLTRAARKRATCEAG